LKPSDDNVRRRPGRGENSGAGVAGGYVRSRRSATYPAVSSIYAKPATQKNVTPH
jgi:hypothetical protein